MHTLFLPKRAKRGLVGAFFGGLLLLGFWLVRDYGVSFDEDVQRATGQVSLLHVFHKLPPAVQHRLVSPPLLARIGRYGNPDLRTYRDRDYGVAFELPVEAAIPLLGLTDKRPIFLFRHLCTFLVSWAGLLAFYTLAARRFGSWRLGLLGTLLLVLSPRQFADFFYNDKDAIFMALLTIAVATAVPFVQRPGWRTAAWHALACALAINVRVMGVLLPAATLVLLWSQGSRGAYRGRARGPAALYLGLLLGLVVALWPYLWEAPLPNFLTAFRNMSHFRWLGTVLYQGQQVRGSQLPWHYSLVWIGLTTPLLYLLLYGLGGVLIVGTVLRRGWARYASAEEWQDLLFLGLSVSPLAAVILLHSALYNGWRQLYFLYPMLLLVAMRGLVAAGRWRAPHPARRYWLPAGSWLVAGSLASIAGQMAHLHPLENLYFNALAPAHPERSYEADYWGLSYYAGLEWLLSHDARPHLRVYSPRQEPLVLNHSLLPLPARQRLELVATAQQADYLLEWYSYQEPGRPTAPRHSVWAGNVHVLDVFRLR